MAIKVITREDLNEFRRLLLKIRVQLYTKQSKQWFKSKERGKRLIISSSTLQNRRIREHLPTPMKATLCIQTIQI